MDRVEELCERMCMFNRGKVVLYGAVQDVRRRWAPNAVLVQGHGDFARVSGVERVVQDGAMIELWFNTTTNPQAVLRELALRPDIRLEHFEVAAPSLDDIFIAVVEGRERVERRADVGDLPEVIEV
jgi:ABC-2 type transport system ATP-binding protein